MWNTYHTPTTLEKALHLLAKHSPEARIIAGGTDLLIELRRGIRQTPVLIDITRIRGLDRIHLDDAGMIHIGPTVTHNQIVASKLLAERGYPLAQACWRVGTPQLRNRGTVAGNLVTASPANDTITPLWAMDARLTLRSIRGERTLALADFYQGVRQTALVPDEMVTDITFPALDPNQRGVFLKLGLRRTHAISLVNVAAVLTFDSLPTSPVPNPQSPILQFPVLNARITLGSVAPTIIRAPEAEAVLVGSTLDEGCIAQAADMAVQIACPINDVRGGADYRCEIVRVLVRRALTALRDSVDGSTKLTTGGSAELATGSSTRLTTGQTRLPDSPPMLWGKGDGHFSPLAGETVTHRGTDSESIVCTVNGENVAVRGASDKTLLAVLREDLGLTGTKEGCGEGECGACTVWMDGIAVFACLVPAPRAHGTRIVTVEGLARGDELHPVQQAFIDEGAVQCGYCTPGFVMSGVNLLQEIPHPTREQIAAGLSGNLCRCTGYYKIVQAIEKAMGIEV
jgi:carbon-monoxide dehydrogenase medium subunit